MKRIACLILPLLVISACNRDFTFVQITDTQIGFDNNRTFELDSVNCMAAAEMINAISPDFVVNTGDLVDNPSDDRQQKAYGAFVDSISEGIEYYPLPGNHDIRGGHKPDCDRFAFVHKRTGFLGFDSNIIKAGESDAEKAQFEWMDAELGKMARCRQIFLFCHIPLVLQSIDEEEDYHNFPKDLRQKYLDLFKKHNVTVLLCGHLHRRHELEIDGIKIISSGATGLVLSKSTKVGIARIKVTAKGYEYEYLDTEGMYPVIEKFIADSWDSYVEKTGIPLQRYAGLDSVSLT